MRIVIVKTSLPVIPWQITWLFLLIQRRGTVVEKKDLRKNFEIIFLINFLLVLEIW